MMRTPWLVLRGAAVVAAALIAGGCGTARRAEPLAGPMRLEDPQLAAGREVFTTKCHQCHPGGEGGLGPAINNKPLPGSLIRLQVRKGLGTMPAFSEEVISDQDLDSLIAYLRALRIHGPESEEQ